jgi:hypothetical protein
LGKDEFVLRKILQLDDLQAIFGTWRYIFDRLQKTGIRFLHLFQTGRSPVFETWAAASAEGLELD